MEILLSSLWSPISLQTRLARSWFESRSLTIKLPDPVKEPRKWMLEEVAWTFHTVLPSISVIFSSFGAL